MSVPRSILFIDGENLTIRYQEMLVAGRKPDSKVVHSPDVFVWHPNIIHWHDLRKVVRVCYYTSVVGDELRVTEVRRALANVTYSSIADDGGMAGQIVPVVFKKPARSQKTRNVDIQIVIDIMRYAFTDEIDRVYLASGDGDYLPLLAEVMRRGKQVEVLALSSGLNEQVTYSVDRFLSLDPIFFPSRDSQEGYPRFPGRRSASSAPLKPVISPFQQFYQSLTTNTIVHTLGACNMNGTPPKQKRTLLPMVSVSLKLSPF